MMLDVVTADTGSSYHRQGSLDGLCGIYSIINALELMLGTDAFDAHKLFLVLLRSLGGQMAQITVRGMRANKLASLLNIAKADLARGGYSFTYGRAFKRDPDHLSEYWQRLVQHHHTHGAGSIIIGMSGLYDHWTCVRSMQPQTVLVADSGVLDEISRSEITIKHATATRRYVFEPMQSFLLTANDRKY